MKHDYRQNTWTLREARSTFMRQMADHARGEHLRQLRSRRGLSQEDVARALGVTAKTYGDWERGGGIHPSNAKKVARYFRVKPGEIITPDIDPEVAPVETVLSAEDAERLRRIEEMLEELLRRADELRPADQPDEDEGDALDELAPDDEDEQPPVEDVG